MGGRIDPRKMKVADLVGDDAKAPWHFKLLMVLVALYLAWRFAQLFGLLA